MNKLIDDGKIQGADCGLQVLDCLGKYNIHRFMNLLSHLGISHSVIHDDDNNKDEHADLNHLIENSKNPLTLSIHAIPKNLESFLNISLVGSDHRKPQHVLFFYSEGKIDAGKLAAFCSIVENCLPKRAQSLGAEAVFPSSPATS